MQTIYIWKNPVIMYVFKIYKKNERYVDFIFPFLFPNFNSCTFYTQNNKTLLNNKKSQKASTNRTLISSYSQSLTCSLAKKLHKWNVNLNKREKSHKLFGRFFLHSLYDVKFIFLGDTNTPS